MTRPQCNLCAGTRFRDFAGRKEVQCESCGSVERTRILKLTLDTLGLVRPGAKVLHFAPELQVAQHIRSTVGQGYKPCDLHPDRYWYPEIGVAKFDLTTDVETLPSNEFDLIIHSHVLEHLPCNETAVLFHLHRALSFGGAHVFSIPIMEGHYECDFGTTSAEERLQRFGLEDHVRRFGRSSLALTIGMVYDVPENDLLAKHGKQVLLGYQIPETCWGRLNSHCFWVARKSDIKLKSF